MLIKSLQSWSILALLIMSNFLLGANPDWTTATTDWDSGQWQTSSINWVNDTVYGTPGTDSYTISELVGEIRFFDGNAIIHQSSNSGAFTGQVILNDNLFEADKLYRLNFKIGTGSSSSRTGDWFVKLGYINDSGDFVEVTPQNDDGVPSQYSWAGTVNDDENVMDPSGGRLISDGVAASDWPSYFSTSVDSAAVGKKVAIQMGIVSGNAWAGFGDDMQLLSMPLPRDTTSMVNSFESGDLQELISTNPDVWADIALPGNGSSSNLPDTTTNPLRDSFNNEWTHSGLQSYNSEGTTYPTYVDGETQICGSFTNNDWLAIKLNQSGTTSLSYQYRGASGTMGTDAYITVEYSELEAPTLPADWTTVNDATVNVLTNVSTSVNAELDNDNVKWVRFSYVGTKGTMVDNITINQLATTDIDYSFESSEFTSYSSGHSTVGAGGVTYTHNDGSEFNYSEGSWTINNGASWDLIRTGDWSWGCTNDVLTVKLPAKYDTGIKGFTFYHKAFNSNAYGTLTFESSADGTNWSPAGNSTVSTTVWEQVNVVVNSDTAQYIRITQTGGSGSGVLGIDDLKLSAYGEGAQTITQEATVVQLTDRAFEGEARDVQMLSLSVPVTGTLDPYTLTELVLNNTGTATFGSDLGNVKIYHTGTEENYLKAVAETNATEIYNGAFGTGTITMTTHPELVSGTNYFFVIYALESAANGGDTLDCSVTGYTFTENVNNGNGDVTQTGWANGDPAGDNIVIRTTGGTKTIKIFMIGGQSNAAGKGLGQYYDVDNQSGTAGVEFWLGGSNAALGIGSVGGFENVASTDFAADVPMATGNRDGATDLLSDAGVEITLAKELKAQLPSDNLAIIKYGYSGSGLGTANGGSNLNWYPGTDGDPDSYDADLGWRYRVFRDSAVLPALRKITENGDSFEILGFYWIQGEADSGRSEAAYRTDLVNLYDRISREFNSPGMYFYNQRLNSAKYSGSAIYTCFTKFGRELISSDVAADQTNVGAYTTTDIGTVNFDLDNVYTIDGNPYGADVSNVENNPNPGMFDGDLHYNSQALEEMGELVAAHYGQTVTPVVGLTLSINSTTLSWTIDEEIDVNKYIVERYENGQWVTYTTVVADNSSVYQVTIEEGYAYRLTVVDNSGHSQTFSPENENISVITVNLNKGWNLVSSPVEDSKMKQVWCWDGTTYYIGDAKPLEGFWMYAEQAKKVDFVGEVATETTQPLATGWNLLGPSENVKAPNLLIYSYEEIYQQMFNDYDLLLQGHGYWIFSLEETTISL